MSLRVTHDRPILLSLKELDVLERRCPDTRRDVDPSVLLHVLRGEAWAGNAHGVCLGMRGAGALSKASGHYRYAVAIMHPIHVDQHVCRDPLLLLSLKELDALGGGRNGRRRADAVRCRRMPDNGMNRGGAGVGWGGVGGRLLLLS